MNKLKDSQVSNIKELHLQGFSERDIARKVGCSRSAVWYQIQKAKKSN